MQNRKVFRSRYTDTSMNFKMLAEGNRRMLARYCGRMKEKKNYQMEEGREGQQFHTQSASRQCVGPIRNHPTGLHMVVVAVHTSTPVR